MTFPLPTMALYQVSHMWAIFLLDYQTIPCPDNLDMITIIIKFYTASETEKVSLSFSCIY